jgi:alpha-mannosidase
MGSTETQILASLGITDPALQDAIVSGSTRLLILDASAHMDWDWLLPFPVLVNGGSAERAAWYFGAGVGPVQKILGQAAGLLADPAYRYSVCETGFLRGFADAYPAAFQALLGNGVANGSLRFAGGGITSPDNLVSHGEAFIRCYLLGHLWLAASCPGLPAPVTAWIPDDFGHDPELPVVLQAMGLVAAGFERIPGYEDPGKWKEFQIDGRPTLAAAVAAGTIDFTWTASDGSAVAGHWLIGGYGQGNTVGGNTDITGYLDLNLPRSPTPYVYVPVLSDFSLPNPNLSQVISGWNGLNMQGQPYHGTTVVATAGSFEEYGQLVGFHAPSLAASYGAEFSANPYWTGYYATRPALKQRHQAATRALLAAEAFSIIAGWAQPNGGSLTAGSGTTEAGALREAWELLAPSTHHDYITGTAIPDVFHTEQVRLLDQAVAAGRGLLRDAMDTIAGAIAPPWDATGAPVAVFNALGWLRSEVVELSPAATAEANLSVSGDGFQPSASGGMLFVGAAPSLGYQTAYLSSASAPANPAACSAPVGPVSGGPVSLSNGLVQATLTPDANGVWGLTSVRDLGNGGAELIAAGKVANDLVFYADGGDEYRFGVENDPQTWTLTDVSGWLSAPTAQVLEAGPLRVVVRTAVRYDDANATIDYVRDYTLHAGEPLLRMRSSGAAPMLAAGGQAGSSVLVAFPLASPVAAVVHGTPCHWTAVQPGIYWNGQTFLPTHDWVIPRDAGQNALAAVYHAGVHAWGLSYQWNPGQGSFDPNDGVLYGCLWRNGNGHYFGWTSPTPGPWKLGTDPEVHVLEYALRVPSGLGAPETGAPLREALAFASPLTPQPVALWTGSLPDSGSLVSSSPQTAMVTVAKPGSVAPGDVVFRVYQPTNAPLGVTLTVNANLVAGGSATARGQTALEQDLDAAAAGTMNVQLQQAAVTFTAPAALSTIALSPQPSAPAHPGPGDAAGGLPGCLGALFRGIFG